MDNLSKELKNLFIIKGRKEKLNEFITRLKDIKHDVIEVKETECRLNQINSDYINNNWNKFVNVEQPVIISTKGNKVIIAFNDDEFENTIIELIKELELNADYTYLLDDDKTGVIVREFFKDGESLLGEEFESRIFDIKQYDFSQCFKMIYPANRICAVNV